MRLLRVRVPELMDDPGLDMAEHERALCGLARLNALAAVDRAVWRVIAQRARFAGRPLRFLDVATGSGDLPLRLAARAARAGLSLDLHACDVSPVALGCASAAAHRAGVKLSVYRADVVADPLPTPDGGGAFDVAHCGLFLHHLDPPDVQTVLARMAGAATMVIVQDLRRTRTGLALAWAASRLLTRSSVVHVDGPRSVRAAYTMPEMADMARAAGLASARITPVRPQRQLLVWERPA
ncbi:MAG: methyltransferase domain-containing protein [Phycisphaerales bacterium]